jgi:uncharacterized protein
VLIVDTGPLLATADRADKDHLACRALLEGEPGPLVTTAMVIAEAAYLIDRQLGPAAEAGLYTAITSGQREVADLGRDDRVRIGDLVATAATGDELAGDRPVEFNASNRRARTLP